MTAKRWLQLVVIVRVVVAVHDAQAFYNPSTGRWLSRDPINELAIRRSMAEDRMVGSNHEVCAYGFAANNPISEWDYLGLDNPGCDLPGWAQPTGQNRDCYLRCCAQHDNCYYTRHGRYPAGAGNRRCTSASWAYNAGEVVGAVTGPVGRFVGFLCGLNRCAQCNDEVALCFARCATDINPPTGQRWFCPNGSHAGEWFDDWDAIPADCWEDGRKPATP